MTRAISKIQCTEAIVKGIEDAHRNYERWSGDWLYQGPEYLISTHVAKRLGSLDLCYVTLESNVKEMLSEAGATKTGRPKKALRSNGRFDIVLWWAKGVPRAVIEAKNGVWSFKHIEHDVHRIVAAVATKNSGSKLQFGAIAFYVSARKNKRSDATTQLENLNSTLLAKTKDVAKKSGINVDQVSSVIHKVDKLDAWAGLCYVFTSV